MKRPQMKSLFLAGLMTAGALLTGCSTTEKGAGIGAAGGAVIGGAVGGLPGAAIGAGAGALGGAAVGAIKEDADARRGR